MRVCVTGATGFVGSALVARLQAQRHHVTAIARKRPKKFQAVAPMSWVECDLGQTSPSFDFLEGVDTLVHLAGRAHVLKERNATPGRAFQQINVQATAALASAAVTAGVKRMIFVSSVGVHGANTGAGERITEDAPLRPLEPYAISKLEAEERLSAISQGSNLEVVTLRPALVAGEGAPGNLARLARLTRRGIPLPVPARENARSFVALNNLISLVVHCLDHPAAKGKTFVVADRQWVSTHQAMQWIAEGAGSRLRTVALPTGLLRAGASLAGQGRLYRKLFDDLRVDAARVHSELDWAPEETLAEALRAVGRPYRD